MRFRRRRSLLPRIRPRPSPEDAAPLKGQLWTRSESALREPDVHPMRRAIAAAVAIAECALLGWLWFGPAMPVRSVDVSGAQHLTPAQVAAAAGLNGNRSVLSVDGESDRRRLLGEVWVRTASVEPRLDGTVVVTVSEWSPVAASIISCSRTRRWCWGRLRQPAPWSTSRDRRDLTPGSAPRCSTRRCCSH